MSDSKIVKAYRLILAALVAGSLIYHIAILWESREKIADGYGDFIIFYTGAQIINDGKVKELFKIETQNEYQAKFNVPQLEWPLPFNHAPYELLPFLPLAYLPYPVAHLIWSGLNVLLLVIMLRWLLAYVNSPHSIFIAVSVIAWFPTMETFRLGQDSILSTTLLLAVFVALKRNRDGWAGFWLALGLYKPQLVLPMAGALLMARQWRSVAVFGVTGALLGTVSLVMVGWQGVFNFMAILQSMHQYSYIIYPANMPNIRGFIYGMAQSSGFEPLVFGATAIISILLYAVCLYLWRNHGELRDLSFDLKFSLTLMATTLASYHLYPHDLFPLTLSFILVFRYVLSGETAHTALCGVFFVLLLIFLLPVMPRYLIASSLLGWGAVPVLLLYLFLAAELFQRERIKPENADRQPAVVV